MEWIFVGNGPPQLGGHGGRHAEFGHACCLGYVDQYAGSDCGGAGLLEWTIV